MTRHQDKISRQATDICDRWAQGRQMTYRERELIVRALDQLGPDEEGDAMDAKVEKLLRELDSASLEHLDQLRRKLEQRKETCPK